MIMNLTLDELKAKATELGLAFKDNATQATLEKLIKEHEAKQANPEELDENAMRLKLEKEQLKLVKVIVTTTDPSKVQYKGEYFSVGNAVLGTVSRFVPFNTEWLVEQFLVSHIKSKEFQHIVIHNQGDAKEWHESKLVPAYNVVELPAPTKEELEELAKRQANRVTEE